MRSRHKWLVAATALCTLIVSACGSSGSGSSSGGDSTSSANSGGGQSSSGGGDILIGMDCDTTSPGGSTYAPAGCKAAQLAIDQVNASGGVLGGRKLKYEEGNDESDATKTPAVMSKFVSDGAKAIFAITSSTGVLQAKQQIEDAKIPVIMSLASNPLIAQPPNNDYLWELASNTQQWADLLCGAFKAKGWNNIDFLEDNTPAQVAYSKTFTDAMSCVHLKIQEVPADATDVSAQVAQIKSDHPDLVLTDFSVLNLELLMQNTLHDQLPDIPRFTLNAALVTAGSQAHSGALGGLLMFAGIDPSNPQSKAVQSFYQKSQGSKFELDNYWAEGYDGVQLLVKAINAAGSDDPDKINEALSGITNYKASFGYPGFTLSFSKTKHQGANGVCGEVIVQWNADNTLGGPWDGYTPDCKAG